MAILDLVFMVLMIAISRVVYQTAEGKPEGANSSKWNVSATAEDGVITVTARYMLNSTDANDLVLNLTCPAGDERNKTFSKNTISTSMRATCDKVRAHSYANITVTAQTGNGRVIGEISKSVFVDVGIPWRPAEIVRHRVNSSVMLVWRTADEAPSTPTDRFLLSYWCAGNSSKLVHNLTTTTWKLTLKPLGDCEEYDVRLYAVNKHGKSLPLYFRFYANETPIQNAQAVTWFNPWIIGVLTVSCWLLVFAVSIVGIFTFRHFRRKRRKEPPSPQTSDPDTAPVDPEAEQLYENADVQDRSYENVDHSRPQNDDDECYQADAGLARDRETDAMVPTTRDKPTARQSVESRASSGYEHFDPADPRFSRGSETAEDDDMYEEVSKPKKRPASLLQAIAKLSTPNKPRTADRVTHPSSIRQGARGKGRLGKKPKPDPRPKLAVYTKPKPSPRPKPKTSDRDSDNLYLPMSKGRRENARERGENSGNGARRNSSTSHDETTEAADDMYVNLPQNRAGSQRVKQSYAPEGRKYGDDLYDTTTG